MKNRKRIFHIITSLKNGGAQEVLKSVCDSTSQNFDHTVFYMVGPNAYKNSFGPMALATALNIGSILLFVRAIKLISSSINAAQSPVCLQGWMYHANLLVIFVKIFNPKTPIFLSVHNGSDRREFTSLSGFISSRVCAFLSFLALSTIFVSKKSLEDHVPYKRSVVISNPIRKLQSFTMASVFGKPDDRRVFNVAFVARFDPIKNIEFMLDVMEGVSSFGLRFRLLMVGDGMSKENDMLNLMLKSRDLLGSVELLGVLTDLSSIFFRADYLISTSKSESFSNVLLESIACGTPFISSEVGIASDLVSPESVIIKGYDVNEWVKILVDQFKIRKTAKVAAAVRDFYQSVAPLYRPERIARLYEACWEKAIRH